MTSRPHNLHKLHNSLESSVTSKEILGELCILSGPIPIDGFWMFQLPLHFKPVAAKCSHCNEFGVDKSFLFLLEQIGYVQKSWHLH